MKAEDLIEKLQAVDPDTHVFYSRGDHSEEVLLAEEYVMCEDPKIGWRKCLSETCTANWKKGILLV